MRPRSAEAIRSTGAPAMLRLPAIEPSGRGNEFGFNSVSGRSSVAWVSDSDEIRGDCTVTAGTRGSGKVPSFENPSGRTPSGVLTPMCPSALNGTSFRRSTAAIESPRSANRTCAGSITSDVEPAAIRSPAGGFPAASCLPATDSL